LIGFLASAGPVGTVGAVLAKRVRKWKPAFQEEFDTAAGLIGKESKILSANGLLLKGEILLVSGNFTTYL
jgi:hypothetical protein